MLRYERGADTDLPPPTVAPAKALVCTIAAHRSAWRVKGGPWHCTICHPPATVHVIEETKW